MQIGFDFNNRVKLARADRELKIRNPQSSDSGVYQCQVINGFGHKELNFTVNFYDPAVEPNHNAHSSISLTSSGRFMTLKCIGKKNSVHALRMIIYLSSMIFTEKANNLADFYKLVAEEYSFSWSS